MGTMIDRLKKMITNGDSEEYTDYSSEEMSEDSRSVEEEKSAALHDSAKKRGTLVALPSMKSQPREQVIIANITGKEQLKATAGYINEDKCVIVNVSMAEQSFRGRALDFLSGTSFARHGSQSVIANNIYMFVPASMDICVLNREGAAGSNDDYSSSVSEGRRNSYDSDDNSDSRSYGGGMRYRR